MSSSAENTLPKGAAAAQAGGSLGRRLFIALLLAGTLGFPLVHLAFGGMSYWLHMLLFVYMNVAIASSWNIIGGYAGYISLGHNVFFAIGGYAAAILFAYHGISPFIAAPIAGVI